MAFEINGGSFIWPEAVIPYLISPSFTDVQRDIVEQAIDEWNTRTIVRLIDAVNVSSYVLFEPIVGSCESPVGLQHINLQPQHVGCDIGNPFERGSVIHEIGHAFGFQHEHQRQDRAMFITYRENSLALTEHCLKIRETNFDKRFGGLLTDYDYGSIMHYPPKHYCQKVPFGEVLTPHDPAAKIGQRDELSSLDILGVNRRYGAPHYSVVFHDDRALDVGGRSTISWAGLTRWGKHSAPQGRAHWPAAIVRNPTVVVDEDRNSIIAYEHETTKTHIRMVALRADGKYHFFGRNHDSPVSDDNRSPDLAVDPSGIFVLVWVEERNGLRRVKGRGYFNNGTTRFPLRDLVSGRSGVPSNPVVGMMSHGQFVVAWAELDDGFGHTVLARRFRSDGTTASPLLTVASGLGDSAVFPRLAVGFEGDFYVAWTREGHQVFVRGFTDDSERFAAVEVSPVAVEPDPYAAVVVSSDSRKHHQPDIALVPASQLGVFRLVVVWTEEIAMPSPGILIHRDETQLGSNPYVAASGPGVADGSISQPTALSGAAAPLAAFDRPDRASIDRNDRNRIDRIESSGEIRARAFFVSGQENHPQFTVNLGTQGDQRRPRIAAFAEDGYVVTWEDDYDRNGLYQINAQRFDSRHNPAGGLQVVNQFAQGQQRQPAIGA